jgi:hypothetical protein
MFTDMFSLPQASPDATEGTSDDKPIVLPESVSAEDFENLLRGLYPARM